MHKAPNLRSRTLQIRGHRSFWIQGVPGLGRTQWYAKRFVPDFAGPFLTITLNFLDLFLCCIALLGGPNN